MTLRRSAATSLLGACLVGLTACAGAEPGGGQHDAGVSSDAGPSNDAGAPTDAGLGTDGGSSLDAGLAIDLASLPPRQWTWVPFADATCRDGSSTGIGINVNPGATQLLLYMKGGGSCFNATSCGATPHTFGAADFAAEPLGGMLNRSNANNPAKDWNLVFIAYCTGDVHLGSNPTGVVPGVVGTQQFVGYRNMTAFLRRLVPTFADATGIVLMGTSAGGFGATGNYEHVARAFTNVPVTLIDDAGPFMASPQLATCLQRTWRELWKIDDGALSTCGSDCSSDNVLADFLSHLGSRYPNRILSLVSSDDDGVITTTFGFGSNACTDPPTPLTSTQFTQGLLDLRARMATDANFGSFIYPGTRHTALAGDPGLNTVKSGGVLLHTWVERVVAGSVSNVGP